MILVQDSPLMPVFYCNKPTFEFRNPATMLCLLCCTMPLKFVSVQEEYMYVYLIQTIRSLSDILLYWHPGSLSGRFGPRCQLRPK